MTRSLPEGATVYTIVVAIACACALLIAACGDDVPGLVTPTPDTSGSEGTTGQSLYNYHCAACHGLDGQPLVASTDDLLDYTTPLDTFNMILDDGPGLMPRYEHFDGAQRLAIYNYIKTFKR